MAIHISHPTNTIEGLDILNINSGNSSNIELNPDSGLVNVNGNISITGNFTVNGSTTTVNSTTTTIVDPIVLLGTDAGGNPASVTDSKDRGIAFYYNDGAGNKTGFFGFDRGTGTFRFVPDSAITGEVVSGNDGTIKIDTVVVNTVSSDTAGDIVIDSGSDSIELLGDTNVTGIFTVSNNAIIYGNLTVQGTTTSVNSTNTEIADNTITLNQGESGAGISSGTSGIEVDRGSLDPASWKYSELTNSWEARLGTNLTAISSSQIGVGNVNITANTISTTDTNGNLNLQPNGSGQVLYNNKHVATHDDAIAYAIVFGG